MRLLTDEAQRGCGEYAPHHIAKIPVEVAQGVHTQNLTRQQRQCSERHYVPAD